MRTSVSRLSASIAAWVIGAAASVAVGMLALSLIDSGPAISTEPLAPQIEPAAGAERPADPTLSPSGSPMPNPGHSHAVVGTPPATQRQFSTVGGTLVARCAGPTAYLLSWSPAQDYRVGRVHRGPAEEVDVAFVSRSHTVVVQVQCVSGVPRADINFGEGE